MKLLLPLLLVLLAPALFAADALNARTSQAAEAQENYSQAMAALLTREALADCIATLDKLITDGEHGVMDDQPDPGMVEANTKLGLHFEFSASVIKKEATIYYLTLSRSGRDFTYSDAMKFAALFADRAALPHPISMTEGDKQIFYAQWLIKPSQWKSTRKKMLKYRVVNRAETDPLRALGLAINRELDARSAVQQSR